MNDVVCWLSDEEIKEIYTSSYWNNVETEKTKAWWIADGNYEQCIALLNNLGLIQECSNSLEYIKQIKADNLKVVDIAAGIGWTSALISKLDNVSEVNAVEMSKHRLDLLLPHSIKMLDGKGDKVNRYLGSFYDLKFDDKSIDVIYMSQAFHHADNPIKLLCECNRILKDKGMIILIGEHYISPLHKIKRFIRHIYKGRGIEFNFHKIFRPDPLDGDHYYRISDYYLFFKSLGLTMEYTISPQKTITIVATRN